MFLCELDKTNIQKSKNRFYLIGGLMSLVGILALAMPFLVAFAIEMFIGGLLLATGLFQAIAAFKGFSDGDKPWQQIFMAIIAFAAGFIFFAKPLAGVLTIAIILSVYFLLEGILKIMEYISVRGIPGAGWILFSGIIAILLAFMMWNNLVTATAMIGILFGVNLLFGGISFLLLGHGCSKFNQQL
ncbi:MAG: hypothetical protein GXZ18_01790 [Synergistaceae bacterium]|nr:hypothetical protein [Synergistaceae bacterium]